MRQLQNKTSRDFGIIEKKDKNGNVAWYARISRLDASGKKKQFTAKAESKSHARRLHNEMSAKFSERGEKAIAGDKLTFEKLAAVYREKKLFAAIYHGQNEKQRKIAGVRSLKPVLHYLNVLQGSFNSKLLKHLTHADIEAFKYERLRTPSIRGERSIADVNRTLALLRSMLNFAVESEWLLKNPFQKGKPLISLSDEKHRERVLTFDEDTALLNACVGRRSHLKPMLILALDTAMRKGELLKLQWKEVDFDERKIRVIALNTKTAKPREVGMTSRVYDSLVELWEKSPKNKTELVLGIKDNVKRSFASACIEVGINDFHFHDCRHTAITNIIAAGIPPMEVMKITGHTQMSTFARYVNPDTAAVTRNADILSGYHQSRFNAEIAEQYVN